MMKHGSKQKNEECLPIYSIVPSDGSISISHRTRLGDFVLSSQPPLLVFAPSRNVLSMWNVWSRDWSSWGCLRSWCSSSKLSEVSESAVCVWEVSVPSWKSDTIGILLVSWRLYNLGWSAKWSWRDSVNCRRWLLVFTWCSIWERLVAKGSMVMFSCSLVSVTRMFDAVYEAVDCFWWFLLNKQSSWCSKYHKSGLLCGWIVP